MTGESNHHTLMQICPIPTSPPGILVQNGGEPGTGGNAYMFESFNAQNATVAELLRLGESGVTVQA